MKIEDPRGVAGVDDPHNPDSSIVNMVGPDDIALNMYPMFESTSEAICGEDISHVWDYE